MKPALGYFKIGDEMVCDSDTLQGEAMGRLCWISHPICSLTHAIAAVHCRVHGTVDINFNFSV